MLRNICLLALLAGAALVLSGALPQFPLLQVLFLMFVIVSVGAALLAIVVGPVPKPIEKLFERCSSLVVVEGRLEVVTLAMMISFPFFEVALLFIAFHSGGSKWFGTPALTSIMSFWAVSVAAALGISAAGYKRGALVKDLNANDSLELARRLDEVFAKAGRKNTLAMFYLGIGVVTQLAYLAYTMSF